MTNKVDIGFIQNYLTEKDAFHPFDMLKNSDLLYVFVNVSFHCILEREFCKNDHFFYPKSLKLQ